MTFHNWTRNVRHKNDNVVNTLSAFFESTRAPMTLHNWTHNVNTVRRKSQESSVELHTKKNRLKRKRQEQVRNAENTFDEDDTRESIEAIAKTLVESEQKLLAKLKRRKPNHQPFPLGPETGEDLLDANPGIDLTDTELFPVPQQPERLKDADRLLEKDAFLENVTQAVERAIRPISATSNGGTLTSMSNESIAIQQRRLCTNPRVSEVYSVEFMELWLREADPAREERPCHRGRHCEGAKIFLMHLQEGDRVPELREFLHFHDRMQFYRTGVLPLHPNVCLLCKLMGVSLGWLLVATMLETGDYAGEHCDFENLFEVPGELLKEFALCNPPGHFFGLPAPVMMFLPSALKPVKRPGAEHLLALKVVPSCRVPDVPATIRPDFR